VDLATPSLGPRDPERLAVEAGRTAQRLRTMSLVRLSAPLEEGDSRAHQALALAQRLTDAAARLVGRPARRLPALPDRAAGDVLEVCARDLVDAVRSTPGGAPGECAAAVDALVSLRRRL